jgi:hypothetical protein
MRLTFILLFSCSIAAVAVAESGIDDNQAIKRGKLKFRLGKGKIAAPRRVATQPQADSPVANPLGFAYVPLPRPKPGTVADVTPYQRGPAKPKVVLTNKRGEVSIALNRLQRERDSRTARNLRPTLKSSWSSAQIKTAVDRCKLVLATTNIDADILAPIGGAGGCGIAAPLLVRSFGAVKVKPAAKLNCNMALATYQWLINRTQPMARKKYRSPVVSIRQLSSFSCRSRRGSGTSRISEHSFGNALDVGSFTLANGKTISILKDWSTTGALFGIGRDANFLFDAHKMACESYATVLSPRYNKAHANHFHMDMGRSGRYKICR